MLVQQKIQAEEGLLEAGALQRAIFNSANFSSIATAGKGMIQIFNVGAERRLGCAAADAMNKIPPADIFDPQEVTASAQALRVELATPISPGFVALVCKAEGTFLKTTEPNTKHQRRVPACCRTLQPGLP